MVTKKVTWTFSERKKTPRGLDSLQSEPNREFKVQHVSSHVPSEERHILLGKSTEHFPWQSHAKMNTEFHKIF